MIHRPEARRIRIVLAAVVLTAVVAQVPGLRFILHPFLLFSTWVHEMAHGVTAMLLGGDFERLVVNADGSGMATYRGTFGPLARGAIASAGYVGTACFGAAIVAARTSRRLARAVLATLGGLMLLSVLLWVRNGFGVLACSALALGLLALTRWVGAQWHPLFLTYLGAQTCVHALVSIRVLYGITEHSDAVTMSELFWLPHWFWATLWLCLSVAVLWLALRLDWRRRQDKPACEAA